MKEIPIHNHGKATLYVGGKAIPTGETRMFHEHEVPPHLRPSAAKVEVQDKPKPDAALLAILDQAINKIVPMLPSFSDEDLAKLEAAEQAGKTRDGMIKAFTEERLRRAAADEAEKNMDDFATFLAEMDENELLAQLELYKEDEGMLGVVNAEIERRAAASEGKDGQDQGGE